MAIASANTVAIVDGRPNERTIGQTSATRLGEKNPNAEATWAALTSPMAPARPAAYRMMASGTPFAAPCPRVSSSKNSAEPKALIRASMWSRSAASIGAG